MFLGRWKGFIVHKNLFDWIEQMRASRDNMGYKPVVGTP